MQTSQRYIPKNIMGLENQGNTCYINSCLQVLMRIEPLNKLLDNDDFIEKINKEKPESIITHEWNSLRKLMWSNEGIMKPGYFLHKLQGVAKSNPLYEQYAGNEQNDTPEFFTFIVDAIHKSVAREVIYRLDKNRDAENIQEQHKIDCLLMKKAVCEKDYSELVDMFYGIQMTKIISMDGKEHTMRPEMFFWIALPVLNEKNEPYINIGDCMNGALKEEQLAGDNAWYTEKTNKKEDVILKKTYWSLPSLVCFHFNRFSIDGTTKIKHQIDFPIRTLDMSPCVEGDNPSQYVYELIGIVNHIGDINDGHYTVFIKHIDDKWYHINDHIIHEVSDLRALSTSLAYCLFYRKKNQ